ncbi:MAG TPA: AMP-binding protein [Kofleriaceae bacterium]|nr:AMP-binding protein [Kofleriaceae bacterium]
MPRHRTGIVALERRSELAVSDGAQVRSHALRSPLRPWPAGPCVHELVSAHARRTPDSVALVYGRRTVSYRELDRRARRLAHLLRDRGVGPDVVVGVCLERSCELIVSLLAVLHAGGAYLPLDPTRPDDQLRFVVADAGARLVIAGDGFAARIDAGRDGAPILVGPGDADVDNELTGGASPAQLAYVLYTASSTGQPEGIRIEHGALAGYIAAVRDEQALGPDDRILQFTDPTFAFAAQEIFGALTAGATLVLRGAELHRSIDGFLDACAADRLTVVVLPTAFLAHLVTEMAARGLAFPTGLRLVFVGGESMTAQAQPPA